MRSSERTRILDGAEGTVDAVLDSLLPLTSRPLAASPTRTPSNTGPPPVERSADSPDTRRIRLIERLEVALERSREADDPLALLLIRLELHRPTGQVLPATLRPAVLQAVADVVSGLILRSDALEWMGQVDLGVLLVGANAIGATGVANKIQRALSAARALAGRDVIATARIGIAVFPDHGTEARSLLDHAYMDRKAQPTNS